MASRVDIGEEPWSFSEAFSEVVQIPQASITSVTDGDGMDHRSHISTCDPLTGTCRPSYSLLKSKALVSSRALHDSPEVPSASSARSNPSAPHHLHEPRMTGPTGSGSSAHTDLAHLRTHILLALAPHLRTQIRLICAHSPWGDSSAHTGPFPMFA